LTVSNDFERTDALYPSATLRHPLAARWGGEHRVLKNPVLTLIVASAVLWTIAAWLVVWVLV